MARNKKQKNIKVKTIGDNPNFTPKELEERAVYEHFEKLMMTLERNLRNAMAEKTGNEETLLEDLENISDQIIKQTYIIKETIGRDTKETNKI